MASQPVLTWPGGQPGDHYLALGLEGSLEGTGPALDNYLLFVQQDLTLSPPHQLNISENLLSSSAAPCISFSQPPRQAQSLTSSPTNSSILANSSSTSSDLRVLTVLLYKSESEDNHTSSGTAAASSRPQDVALEECASCVRFNWTAWIASMNANPTLRMNFDVEDFALRAGLGEPVASEVLLVKDESFAVGQGTAAGDGLSVVSTLTRAAATATFKSPGASGVAGYSGVYAPKADATGFAFKSSTTRTGSNAKGLGVIGAGLSPQKTGSWRASSMEGGANLAATSAAQPAPTNLGSGWGWGAAAGPSGHELHSGSRTAFGSETGLIPIGHAGPVPSSGGQPGAGINGDAESGGYSFKGETATTANGLLSGSSPGSMSGFTSSSFKESPRPTFGPSASSWYATGFTGFGRKTVLPTNAASSGSSSDSGNAGFNGGVEGEDICDDDGDGPASSGSGSAPHGLGIMSSSPDSGSNSRPGTNFAISSLTAVASHTGVQATPPMASTHPVSGWTDSSTQESGSRGAGGVDHSSSLNGPSGRPGSSAFNNFTGSSQPSNYNSFQQAETSSSLVFPGPSGTPGSFKSSGAFASAYNGAGSWTRPYVSQESSGVQASGNSSNQELSPSRFNGWTVSTVYSTSVYSITACAETVTDCPARTGSVTTDVVVVSTTICPISNSTAFSPNSQVSPLTASTGASSGLFQPNRSAVTSTRSRLPLETATVLANSSAVKNATNPTTMVNTAVPFNITFPTDAAPLSAETNNPTASGNVVPSTNIAAASQNWTVSTVYSTSVHSIISCAASVTDCPLRAESMTTDIVVVSTTICPVTESGSGSAMSATEVPMISKAGTTPVVEVAPITTSVATSSNVSEEDCEDNKAGTVESGAWSTTSESVSAA